MNAIGYFLEGARRNSVKRSVAEQNRAFTDFCTKQGYEVIATFLDTEGQEDPDSGFRQMLAYLQRDPQPPAIDGTVASGHAGRGFAVVVVDCLGVLGTDLGRAAVRLLTVEAAGAQVVSVHDGREAARALVTTWADRGEGTPVSERVRAAMRRKAIRGEVLGRPPYGYRVGPRHRLELISEEAVVVRYIFRLYLQEGMGIRKIAGQLNEENVPTRRGGRWSMVSIRDLLRNRAYLGTYTRFGVKVPGSHPPLVSADDFRRVQERLQSRYGGTRERTVVPFLLSGLAYCARCGSRMIGVSRRQAWKTKSGEQHSASYRYYQCESRTNQNACGYNTQRAPVLEAAVRDHLANADATSTNVTRLHKAGNADAYLLDMTAQVDRIESRIRKTRRQVEELVADAAHGHITIERMRSLGTELAHEAQGQEAELQTARLRLQARQTEAERAHYLEVAKEHLLANWDTLEFDALQLALREVIDRIDVDGSEMRLYLRP
ncbi:hypothetical protein AYO38_02195 [bacterium SCGC AG-212-C10]|nr:hypothetical protein AYO38_02195 [bacterium SCGC AG-212-C10]